MDFTQGGPHAARLSTEDFQQTFTLFDSVLQTRLVKRRSAWNVADCYRVASSLFPHLGPQPTVRKLDIEIVGLPRPQFAATAAQDSALLRSFPVDCRALQRGICVVNAPMAVSPFTLAHRTYERCQYQGIHAQVAKRSVTAYAHSAAFLPFEPLPQTVDSVCLYNIADNTPPSLPSTDLSWRADVIEQIVEVQDMLEDVLRDSDVFQVMVHRPGMAPMEVDASRIWNAGQLADAISAAVGTQVDVHWPGLIPRGTDGILHALIEPTQGLAEGETLLLFDAVELRPVGPRFSAVVAPERLTLGEIFCIVRETFPDAYYPSEIQVNGRVIEATGLRRYYCPLIRPVTRTAAIRRPGQLVSTGIRPQLVVERLPGLALDLQLAQREHAERSSSSSYSEEVTGAFLLQLSARRKPVAQTHATTDNSFQFRVWRPGFETQTISIPSGGSFDDAGRALQGFFPDVSSLTLYPVFRNMKVPCSALCPQQRRQIPTSLFLSSAQPPVTCMQSLSRRTIQFLISDIASVCLTANLRLRISPGLVSQMVDSMA